MPYREYKNIFDILPKISLAVIVKCYSQYSVSNLFSGAYQK